MTRETVQAKASRYLAEARLTVTLVDGDRVSAHCRGGGEVWRLGHDPGRGWWCNCPARTDQCAHLIGLRLVTARRQPPAGIPTTGRSRGQITADLTRRPGRDTTKEAKNARAA